MRDTIIISISIHLHSLLLTLKLYLKCLHDDEHFKTIQAYLPTIRTENLALLLLTGAVDRPITVHLVDGVFLLPFPHGGGDGEDGHEDDQPGGPGHDDCMWC